MSAQSLQDYYQTTWEYRDSVYNHLKNGDAEKVNVRLGTFVLQNDSPRSSSPASRNYSILTLDEIETIYLLQYNFTDVLDILTNNEFGYDKSRYRYAVPKIDAEPPLKDSNLVMVNGVHRSTIVRQDSLWIFQSQLLIKQEDQILEAIEQTQFDAETKAFLALFLKYKIGYHVDAYSEEYIKSSEILLDTYNELNLVARKEGKDFLINYPDSKYRPFIEKFITTEYKLRNYALGFEFLVGSMVPYGSISTYEYPSFYCVLGTKLYYKKTFLNVNGGVGLNAGKQEFFYDTLWNGIGSVTASVQLGRVINIGQKFSISPIIGVKKIWNSHAGSDGFGSSLPLTYGFEMNFGKFVNKTPYNSFSPFIYSGRELSGYHVRILFQNPGYDQFIPELKGGILTVVIGANIAFFDRKYEKYRP